MNSEELAEATGTYERYIREWLATQVATDTISYNPESQKFFMTPEHEAVFAGAGRPSRAWLAVGRSNMVLEARR